MGKDYRPKDIERLKSLEIDRAWDDFWDSYMCKEISNVKDEHQMKWHLSRISFLIGYVYAKRPKIIKNDFDWVEKSLKTIDVIYCKKD